MTHSPDLPSILRSGYVRRYHAHPDMAHLGDTLGFHHSQVAQIIMALHPAPTIDLIRAALHHDCGELGMGDMASPFRRANPEIDNLMRDAEATKLAQMGIRWKLEPDEQRWLHFADKLAAYLHVKHVAPHLLTRDGWPETRAWLVEEVFALNCAQVLPMLNVIGWARAAAGRDLPARQRITGDVR